MYYERQWRCPPNIVDRDEELPLAKKKVTTENGQDRLGEATAMLIQNMAILTQNQATFLNQIAEIERSTAARFARIDERFARMEQDMTAIMRVLADHGRLLERLPEAVRDKIGFKG